ncbi:regulator of G-protein signaling 22-like [Tubulanus polymorphus]|uniref:regulator of G-protein signaling 22-like n=1 Tax=Tubulanus polymorphus TaxID=672921 RepID=UPI003DA3C471
MKTQQSSTQCRVIKVFIDPPDIELEDFEDALATDELFVEYFNYYLSLPCFHEKLLFNKDTGGFEVVNNARKELSKKIKTAVRSQKRRNRIYRPVKKHSYIDIPLIPIEDVPAPPAEEIDTTFTVQALNKEQGIEWIKKERLPSFLESDCYMEYRLAKLVSQSKLYGKNGEIVTMRIHDIPRPRKPRNSEIEAKREASEREKLIKDCYVSMGNASSTETEVWVSQARLQQKSYTITTSSIRPSSAVQPSAFRRVNSARPKSAFSLVESSRDSGYSSPTKSLMGSYATMGSRSLSDMSEEMSSSRVFEQVKPLTPRPSETVCVTAEDDISAQANHSLIFLEPQNVVGTGDTDADDEDDEEETLPKLAEEEQSSDTEADAEVANVTAVTNKPKSVSFDRPAKKKVTIAEPEPQLGEAEPELERFDITNADLNDPHLFFNIDDLGAVIVGTVLKFSISKLTGFDAGTVAKLKQVRTVFPDPKYKNFTYDDLDQSSYCQIDLVQALKLGRETVQSKQVSIMKGKKADSDEDSLLDSEEDFEEDQDLFFRRHKVKHYELTNRKGIQQFVKFLKGKLGDRCWNFWIDIDKARFMSTEEEKNLYMISMREKFHNTGSLLELPNEMKVCLGLCEPSNWTIEKLLNVQSKMAESLVLYWGPRFLLKQNLDSDEKASQLVKKLVQPSKIGHHSYPNPPVATLLPLRPKTCAPRIRNGIDITAKKPDVVITDAIKVPSNHQAMPDVPKTAPLTGLKRKYHPSSLDFARNWIPGQKPQPPKTEAMKKKPFDDERSLISPALRSDAGTIPAYTPSLRPSSAYSASVSQKGRFTNQDYETQSSRRKNSGVPSHHSSRPSSAPSHPSKEPTQESSVFFGGVRLEAMLQALGNEGKSGAFFKKYVSATGNQIWCNCLDFWNELQNYHQMFYHDVIDQFHLEKKSQAIYSRYVVDGADRPINCDPDVKKDIAQQILPPYEELFDRAEEYVLTVLHEAWQQINSVDSATFEKIELIEIKRHLETKNKYVLNLQRSGLIRQRSITPEDPMEGYEDPVYDPSLFDRIPPEFHEFTLDKLVYNRIELEHFRQFLAENYASMDLMCWMDIEAFRRIPHTEELRRDAKAKDIRAKYLTKKYFFGPNSPAGKAGQEKVMAAGGGWGKLLQERPPTQVMLDTQKYVGMRLEKKWLPLFLITEEFAERQKPSVGMDDVVDDVLLQRKKKSAAVMKMLESKWVSSSKDIITFRKALNNPMTSLQFRRYVSIKGDSLENDVLFWLEVQRYKDLHHQHSEEVDIFTKVNAIINCFIDSQIPPSLQIDIPEEQAEKILDKRKECGPYLFREAQLTVFRILFGHWNDFSNYRSNLTADKVLPTIERQRRRAKLRQRAENKHLEELKEKEELERARKERDEDTFADPFGEDREDEGDKSGKEKLSWTYSQYLQALDQEETLNNVDESTFSTVSEQMQIAASVKSSQVDQMSSVINEKKNSRGLTSPSGSKRSSVHTARRSSTSRKLSGPLQA